MHFENSDVLPPMVAVAVIASPAATGTSNPPTTGTVPVAPVSTVVAPR